METGYAILAGVLVLAFIAAVTVRRCVILEYERGLLYKGGKFVTILQPGVHWYYGPSRTYRVIDVRTQNVTIPGQEVLSADNVSIRVSLGVSYRVTDPYRVLNQFANFQEALYLLLQLNLRDEIGSLAIEDLLAKREEVGRMLFDRSAGKAAEIGLELLQVGIKDIMFPGELKNMFAQVVNARKEGLAALERARGESAALRSLANAARVLDDNPSLRQLRLFQVLEKSSGNTVIVLPSDQDQLARSLASSVPASTKKTKKG